MSNAIVLDIETAPIADVQTYLEPVSAPSNYKDPEKIKAFIEEKTIEKANNAGLDADLGQIVCIGWLREDIDKAPRLMVCRDEHEERQALTALWGDILSGGDLITFNGFRFDLPFIMRRSLYLRVPYRALSIDRYRSNHIDLFQKLTFNGQIDGHSLSFYAQRFGLTGDLDVKGSEIAALARAGQWDAIKAHCEQDVWWTADIAKRLGYWDGVGQAEADLTLAAQAVGF